ncbi:hypothetical protein PCE1_003297 [Barthelona sp. PCE]
MSRLEFSNNDFHGGDETVEMDNDEEIILLELEEAKELQEKEMEALDEKDFLEDDSIITEPVKEQKTEQSLEERMQEISVKSDDLNNVLLDYNEKAREMKAILKEIDLEQDEKQHQYLKMKVTLLSNYIANLQMLAILLLKGKKVGQHPVVKHLTDLRVLITRMEGLDRSIYKGIREHIKVDEEEEDSEIEIEGDENKRVLDELVVDPLLENQAHQEYREEEREQKRQAYEIRKAQRTLQKSKILRQLQSDLVGVPTEIDENGTTEGREHLLEQERMVAESGVMHETKKDKQRRRDLARVENMDDIEVHEDFSDIVSAVNVLKRTSSKAQELGSLFNEMVEQKKQAIGGEEDLPYRTHSATQPQMQQMPVEPVQEAVVEDLSDDDFDDDFYNAVKNQKTIEKQERKEQYMIPEEGDKLEELSESGKRRINREVEKNRGLHRYRKREDSNPRMRMRNKYNRALKKLRGIHRSDKTEDDKKKGEVYIARDLVRARKARK